MLKELKAKGVPIDGVGIQADISPKYPINKSELFEVVSRLTASGLMVEFTELDVAIPTRQLTKREKIQALKIQAGTYRIVAETCREFDLCQAITLWGLGDSYSWVPDEFPGLGEATLFDKSLSAKPVSGF